MHIRFQAVYGGVGRLAATARFGGEPRDAGGQTFQQRLDEAQQQQSGPGESAARPAVQPRTQIEVNPVTMQPQPGARVQSAAEAARAIRNKG